MLAVSAQARGSLALPLLNLHPEDSAMANRRRPTVQLPDPTSVTQTAIDAGAWAIDMTATVARGLARGAMAAARAMSESVAQASEETTRAASDVARKAAPRTKRVPTRATPRRRAPSRTRGRRRRAA